MDEIRKQNSKGNNEHGPKNELKRLRNLRLRNQISCHMSGKPAKCCRQSHMNILGSSENNQSFYSIADLFVRFTTLGERNVLLQEEKSNVAPDRSKMITRQDAAAVYAVPPIPLPVVLLFLPLFEGKIWKRLENKTPREIMNMDREE